MARGTLIVVALLVGLSALVSRSCQKSMSTHEEHLHDLHQPGDEMLRSSVVIAEEASRPMLRPPTRLKYVWKLPVL